MVEKTKRFLLLPANSPTGLAVIILIGISIIFGPQVSPNDWEINTSQLFKGLSIYKDAEFLYPPWSLVLLWPYRLMQSYGARLFALLVVAWLASSRGWSLGRLLAIVFNALFIYSIMFSNLDMLVMTFPVIVWERSRNWRYPWIYWGLAISLMLLKPQGMVLLLPYLIMQRKQQSRQLIFAFLLTLLIILPVSLLGSPPLVLQWLENVFTPSAANQHHFVTNNISLVNRVGWVWGIVIVSGVFYGTHRLMKRRRRRWTQNHMYAALLLASMLLSPYTSSQSVIAALVFVPSWGATLIQYGLLGVVIGLQLTEYRFLSPLWIVLFGIISLWLYKPDPVPEEIPPE